MLRSGGAPARYVFFISLGVVFSDLSLRLCHIQLFDKPAEASWKKKTKGLKKYPKSMVYLFLNQIPVLEDMSKINIVPQKVRMSKNK